MNTKKKARLARWLAGAGALVMVTFQAQVYAYGSHESAFNTRYDTPAYSNSQTAANAGCQTCHGQSTNTWNEYGWQLRLQGTGTAIADRMANIEGNTSININNGTTMLDEIMGWAAIYLLKKFVLTKNMSVEFIKPVFIGSELKVEGKVLQMTGKREALMGGFIFGPDGDLCATSTGTFPLLTPALAKRLGVVDDTLIESFEPLMRPDA